LQRQCNAAHLGQVDIEQDGTQIWAWRGTLCTAVVQQQQKQQRQQQRQQQVERDINSNSVMTADE
jgi:hypothetical protein